MAFDIDRYKELAGRLDDGDVDYDAFRDDPLPEGALRCLRYMHDVEHHTACYLRDLLVTRAHKDPELTTFLTIWAYEELWHGEAIAKVLAVHGEPAGAVRVERTRARHRIRDAATPLAMQITSGLTAHLAAVHMTWGAVNEWTTQAGYARLSQRTGHPVLSDLLGRISRQEGRHIDFYATQATRRLEASAAARRLTRFALRRFWAPVGSGVMPAPELDHLVRWLFTGPEGQAMAERIDRRIDRLPGLDGLNLISGAAELVPA